MATMRTIFHTGCLVMLAAALTGCGPRLADTDDEFRILLNAWNGPDHATTAANVKGVIERDGFKNLTIVAKQNMTELYMGRYVSVKAAEPDLKKAQAYRNVQWGDVRLFEGAKPILIPGKDIGPPEWNLLNVHPRYTYTVAVMIYHDDAGYIGRRQQAVNMCRKLREQGELAFFHHGPRNSSVCVGLFKVNAVRTRQVPVDAGAGTKEQRIHSLEIQATIQKYPRMYENGNHVKMTVPSTDPGPVNANASGVTVSGNQRLGSVKEMYAPSCVIDIPRRPSASDPFAGFGDS